MKLQALLQAQVLLVPLRVQAPILLDEAKGKVHAAAKAAAVAGSVAVDQLMLAEGGQLSRDNGIDALHGSSGRKRPTGAALHDLYKALKAVESKDIGSRLTRVHPGST